MTPLRRILVGALLVLAPLAAAPTIHPRPPVPEARFGAYARPGALQPGPAILCPDCR